MLITFLKQYGPFSEGETVEMDDNAAAAVIAYGVAVEAAEEARHATAEPHKKRTATKRHAEG